MAEDINKKVILIISGSVERTSTVSSLINKTYKNSTIYTAPSSPNGLAKLRNANIDVVICDEADKKVDGVKITSELLTDEYKNTSIIILGHPPKEQMLLDEIVTGKVYFIEETIEESEFISSLTKALDYSSNISTSQFNLRYLNSGELLMKEGEAAQCVYIVMNGELTAYLLKDGVKNVLGTINAGEFVGEMAYFNNERRSAFIEAAKVSELIEIPFGQVEKLIFSRPSWSKALIQTLSKRLRTVNKLAVE